MDKKLKSCLFCKRDRFDEFGEELWKSDMVLSPTKTSNDIIFTICPFCRNERKIVEIYTELTKI